MILIVVAILGMITDMYLYNMIHIILKIQVILWIIRCYYQCIFDLGPGQLGKLTEKAALEFRMGFLVVPPTFYYSQ